MINIKQELEVAKKASEVAAKLLIDNKDSINKILSNKGRDVKLKADLESEKVIKEYLSSHSNFPILAEESGANQDLGKSFWVVDPLDGTSNYSRNFPMCCISIALIYEKKITLGVINDFNRGLIYEGSTDSKAKLNGQEIFVSSINEKSKATLATGLPAKGNFGKESMSELSNELVSWKKVRMIGSAAMSCAYVASGQFDQYQEKGIFLWDIAAGLSIIKAAGGDYTFKPYNEDQFKVDVIANNGCLRIK